MSDFSRRLMMSTLALHPVASHASPLRQSRGVHGPSTATQNRRRACPSTFVPFSDHDPCPATSCSDHHSIRHAPTALTVTPVPKTAFALSLHHVSDTMGATTSAKFGLCTMQQPVSSFDGPCASESSLPSRGFVEKATQDRCGVSIRKGLGPFTTATHHKAPNGKTARAFQV
ncbi:hypothetical protein BC834DRAFT_857524 [Gloeopeniophorella convolvens]|nr:hypothetical protein BC834DRAFT_857524 [Gloeopeniophorella convolvens]